MEPELRALGSAVEQQPVDVGLAVLEAHPLVEPVGRLPGGARREAHRLGAHGPGLLDPDPRQLCADSLPPCRLVDDDVLDTRLQAGGDPVAGKCEGPDDGTAVGVTGDQQDAVGIGGDLAQGVGIRRLARRRELRDEPAERGGHLVGYLDDLGDVDHVGRVYGYAAGVHDVGVGADADETTGPAPGGWSGAGGVSGMREESYRCTSTLTLRASTSGRLGIVTSIFPSWLAAVIA